MLRRLNIRKETEVTGYQKANRKNEFVLCYQKLQI